MKFKRRGPTRAMILSPQANLGGYTPKPFLGLLSALIFLSVHRDFRLGCRFLPMTLMGHESYL